MSSREPEASLRFVARSLPNAAGPDGPCAVEALMFPEFCTLADKERAARASLEELAGALLQQSPLEEISRRVVAGTPETLAVEVQVEPAQATGEWSEPVTTTLHAVAWQQGAHVLATVPALGIAVIAPDRERLAKMLPAHVLAAVKRGGWNRSRLRLATLCSGAPRVLTESWQPRLDSPLERHKAGTKEESGADPLAQLTTRMEANSLPRAHEVAAPLARLARLLALEDAPSVLLVGPAGVGKTALVEELARRRGDFGLSRRAFHRSSGARLIAGACGFGMWQQRCRQLLEAARERSVVLCLGNLFELTNVGQSSAGSESIAGFLQPALVRREAQVIVECTPDQLALIEKNEPRLCDAFRVLHLEEPTPAQSAAILRAVATQTAGASERFAPAALDRVAALHRRYLGCSAFPGTPLRFLRRLHEGSESGVVIGQAEVDQAFSAETGMPRALLDPAVPLDLDTTRDWFRERVQGQDEAVDAVVAMIARVKAGLSRPGRPLASLLFTGPTGTGKTELAKSLAEFLFQGPERMIRLDMSEYSQPWSAQRLVSGSHDGREGLLTAAVREQPFCVLLLDEFEKADPAVFDLLLQVLGEARLTDAAGRTADFANCVVIMTSNLGAEGFGRGTLGFRQGHDATPDAGEHFTSAVRAALRPEMFNRIDRIIPFQPLGEDVVLALTRREVAAAALRSGFTARGIVLEASERLLRHLARQGHDPRYGARPLKRRVAGLLLAPVAARLAEGVPDRTVVRADLAADGESVTLQLGTAESHAEDSRALRQLRDRLDRAAELRLACERLRGSTMVGGLTGRLRALHQRLLAVRRKSKAPPPASDHDPEIQPLKRCLDRIEHLARRQHEHEETLLLALGSGDGSAIAGRDPLDRAVLEEATLEAFGLWQPPPARLALVIQGQPGKAFVGFAKMYHELALRFGGNVTVAWFARKPPVRLISHNGLEMLGEVVGQPAEAFREWQAQPGKLAAIVLWVEGRTATMMLRHEGGVQRCRVAPSKKEADDERAASRATDAAPKDWECRIEIRQPEPAVRSLEMLALPLAMALLAPEFDSGVQLRQFDPVRRMVREGGERAAGEFTLEWLAHRLRGNVLEEALE